MDKGGVKENMYKEEQADGTMGLSDIIDILNTLDNNSPPSCIEASIPTTPNIFSTPSSGSSSPIMNPPQSQSPEIGNKRPGKPYIRIVEQPANKALRFRYECEGRSAGSIPGANSTAEVKTFPVIEIANYKGEVTIVVSCVTKDPPYRAHPHNLVGKEGCEHGICTMRIKGDPPRAVFSNLGVQCVRRKDIKAALELRESKKVDPFKTKFAHKDQPSSIDLNVVRLCFQAFIQTGSRQYKKLQPVVTEPVYDRKAVSNLAINRLCSCSAKISGGDEIIMLCEKVPKDIKIKFYELNSEGYEIWQDYAEFQHSDIHKGTAIAFKTPRYHNLEASQKVQVYIQLERPSDGATSEPLPFEYYPDQDQIKRKRLKSGNNAMNILRKELQKHEQTQKFIGVSTNGNVWNITPTNIMDAPLKSVNNFEIKAEEHGVQTYQNFGPHRSPYQMTPSPQPVSPINRNIITPSPSSLMKTPSPGSQTQMMDTFNPVTVQSLNSINNIINSNNSNLVNTLFNEQNFLGVSNINYTTNNNQLSPNTFSETNNTLSSLKAFVNTTSGGSFTPIWLEHDNVEALRNATTQYPHDTLFTNVPQNGTFNQNPSMDTAPPVANTFQQPPMNVTSTSDTFNSLLQIESDEFIHLNSTEDRKIANLSIST